MIQGTLKPYKPGILRSADYEEYLYWIFVCRNEKCCHIHDYAYLGTDETVNVADLPLQHSFSFTCPRCGTPSLYTQWDLGVSLKPCAPEPNDVFIASVRQKNALSIKQAPSPVAGLRFGQRNLVVTRLRGNAQSGCLLLPEPYGLQGFGVSRTQKLRCGEHF